MGVIVLLFKLNVREIVAGRLVERDPVVLAGEDRFAEGVELGPGASQRISAAGSDGDLSDEM
jgi:hypothetical protein